MAFPYRVEVSSGGSAAKHVSDCQSASVCAATQVVFFDYTPSGARITLISPAGTRTVDVTPSYVQTRPNGPNCEPICSAGTVTVAVP